MQGLGPVRYAALSLPLRPDAGSRQDSLCPSPVKVRRVGVLLTDLDDESGFPLGTGLVVWGSALARLGWTAAPVVFLYRPEADSIMGAGVPVDGGWTAPLAYRDASIDRADPLIEEKGIEYIVGLAAMAPVVAGACLGENADALARAVRGLIEDGPAPPSPSPGSGHTTHRQRATVLAPTTTQRPWNYAVGSRTNTDPWTWR